MRIVTTMLFLGVLVATACGCGGREGEAPNASPAIDNVEFGGGGGEMTLRDVSASMLNNAGSIENSDKGGEVERKTIYTANVYLIVEDLDALSGKLGTLLKKHDAKIASEDRSGAKGQSRSGTWKVRVPAKEFESLLAAVAQLGELERTSTNSQDVTEEYYDLEARITQKTAEEKGLLKLQEEAAAILNKDPKARMEDLLAVRKEWTNVRQEIERMTGRLKLIKHLTELTTVTITVNERKGYVPPTQPGFGTQIGRTFEGSLSGLRKFGQGIVLVAVAATPWLTVLAILLVPFVLLLRWRRRPRVVSSNP